jgi:hypothetical protein
MQTDAETPCCSCIAARRRNPQHSYVADSCAEFQQVCAVSHWGPGAMSHWPECSWKGQAELYMMDVNWHDFLTVLVDPGHGYALGQYPHCVPKQDKAIQVDTRLQTSSMLCTLY